MNIKPSPAAGQLKAVPPQLHAYLLDYFKGGRLPLIPPQDNLIFVEGLTSMVLHRAGRFQVELVVVSPNVKIPEHVHDDVDSYEIAVSGQIEFHVSGIQVGFFRSPRADGSSRDSGRYLPVSREAWHWALAGPAGATFMSVQMWREGVKLTHVGRNWRGAETMGERHNAARS